MTAKRNPKRRPLRAPPMNNGRRRRGPMPWTSAEGRTVRRLYPDYDAMMQALPHRTYWSLRNATSKFAADKKHRRQLWTAREVSLLTKLIRRGACLAEVMLAMPDRNKHQLKCQAYSLGLKFGRRYVAFDAQALHQVRQLATEYGFSLIELDRIARTGRYFQKSTRHPVYKHILKAIRALGGTLDVDWNREA